MAGWAHDLAVVGDQDGDGVDDLAVVYTGYWPGDYDDDAPPSRPSRAFVVSTAGGVLREVASATWPRTLAAGTGDATGDGWPDVLLSASPDFPYSADSPIQGRLILQPGGPAAAASLTVFEPPLGTDGEMTTAWLGDLHSDGFDDFAVLQADVLDGVAVIAPSFAVSLWAGGAAPLEVSRWVVPDRTRSTTMDTPWDADRDGAPDLLIASDIVYIVRYSAAGLERPEPFGAPLAINPYRVAHGDVDGDGLDDLVVSTACSDGTTTFVTRFGAPAGLGSGAPDAQLSVDACSDWTLADHDADGVQDLFVAQARTGAGRPEEGVVRVLPGGPGGPNPAGARVYLSGVRDAEVGSRIAVVGGASPRLAVASLLPGSLTGGGVGLWPVGAPGQASLPTPWRSSPRPLGTQLTVADFDGDGFDDLALDDDDGLAVHLGGPSGLDPAPVAFLADGDLQLAGDVDADGLPDALWTSGDGARVLLGGPGGPRADRSIPAPAPLLTPVGDTDGDGAAEFLDAAAYPIDGLLETTLYEQGAPPIAVSWWLTQGSGTTDARLHAAGDLNGDGYHDLVLIELRIDTLRRSEGGLASWIAGGPTGFAPPRPLAEVTGDFTDLTVQPVGDVDGDGFRDLALGEAVWVETFDHAGVTHLGAPRGRVRLFRGGPAGPTLAAEVRGDAGAGRFGAQIVPLGDQDGDGFGDLAVSTVGGAWTGAGVALFNGTATGLAAAPTWVGGCELAGSQLAGGDFDGDGRAELVASTGARFSAADVWIVSVPLDTDPPVDTHPPVDTDTPDTAAPAVPTPRVPVADPACGCAHGGSGAGAIALLAVALRRRRSQASPAR